MLAWAWVVERIGAAGRMGEDGSMPGTETMGEAVAPELQSHMVVVTVTTSVLVNPAVIAVSVTVLTPPAPFEAPWRGTRAAEGAAVDW